MKSPAGMVFVAAVVASGALCGCEKSDDGGTWGHDDGRIYDVVTEVHYKYVQPSVDGCANPETVQEATLRFTMPGREYDYDGCGDVQDGRLFVLCDSGSLDVEVVNDKNGASWQEGLDTTASNYLSIFRLNGRTWLDFRFSAESSGYPDPGCSGETVTTALYTSTLDYVENDNEYVMFDEIDLSLGLQFNWTGHFESEDKCDIGCFITADVAVHFNPAN